MVGLDCTRVPPDATNTLDSKHITTCVFVSGIKPLSFCISVFSFFTYPYLDLIDVKCFHLNGSLTFFFPYDVFKILPFPFRYMNFFHTIFCLNFQYFLFGHFLCMKIFSILLKTSTSQKASIFFYTYYCLLEKCRHDVTSHISLSYFLFYVSCCVHIFHHIKIISCYFNSSNLCITCSITCYHLS